MLPMRLPLVLAFVVATALLAGAPLAGARTQAPPPKLHTIDQTETLVKARLAAELKVPISAITVVLREERRWPDAAFGCAPRKGVFEPVPTDGFAFTLAHAGQRYAFRTDKYGTIRRCPAGKPRASV
jgi:hypothetical protein